MHGIRTLVATAVLAAALAPGACLHAQAEPDTFRLGEIVVTAARLPVPAASAPGSITVVTGEQLRERGIRYAADAVRLVPGATVVQGGGAGGLTSVFLRGGESDYVQVLVDGIQVNDPGGAFDWAHLRADDIERIEVVRGPASVLYGSDAVAGVVQIFTRAGGAPRVDAAVTTSTGERQGPDPAGRFTTHAVDASLTGSSASPAAGGARLRYGVSAGRQESSGLYALNSGYGNSTVSSRLQLVTRGLDAAVTARLGSSHHRYPTDGSGAVVDPNQFSTVESRSLGLDAGYRLLAPLELRVLATAHASDTRVENPPDGDGDGEYWSTSAQERARLDARLNAYLRGSTVLTVGAEHEWQAAATAWESVSEWGAFAEDTDERRRNSGFYAQAHAAPASTLALTAGGRLDRNQRFGTFATGRLAASWTPLPGARLHGAAGSAFKEPTFFENFAAGYATGNPDLDPEHARSWEAGAEVTAAAGRLVIGATWFDQRFRNLIQYTATPPVAGAPNYYNVGAARSRGAEASLRLEVGTVSASASFTRTDARATDAGFGDDRAFRQDGRLLRRPRSQAHASAALRLAPAVRAMLDVRHAGEREDLDFTGPAAWTGGERITLPSYATADVGVEYAAMRRGATRMDVTLRVRNLFDERYQEIHNFPAPGRLLQLGVRAGTGL
jgi:vitamin B12 transporter